MDSGEIEGNRRLAWSMKEFVVGIGEGGVVMKTIETSQTRKSLDLFLECNKVDFEVKKVVVEVFCGLYWN